MYNVNTLQCRSCTHTIMYQIRLHTTFFLNAFQTLAAYKRHLFANVDFIDDRAFSYKLRIANKKKTRQKRLSVQKYLVANFDTFKELCYT